MKLIDVVTSFRVLLARVVYASVCIIMIWRIEIMDYLAFTPVEFLPYLVIMGFLITLGLTYKKGKLAYQETAKEKLRNGTWATAPDYGMDFLAANITCVIIGAAATVLVPGIIYDMLGAVPTLSGCLAIGLVVAVFVGVKGPKSLSEVVDMFHNNVKIKDLENQNKPN